MKTRLENFWLEDFGTFCDSNLTPEIAVDAILAAVTIHNLRRKSLESCTPDLVDELGENLGGKIAHKMLCYNCPLTNRIKDIQNMLSLLEAF